MNKTNTSSKSFVKHHASHIAGHIAAMDPNAQPFIDFKNALLLVSMFVNAFILTGWVTLQVTTMYDAQVATLLFVR